MIDNIKENRKQVRNIINWEAKHPGKKLNTTKNFLKRERLKMIKDPYKMNWDKLEFRATDETYKQAKKKLEKIEKL